MLIVQSFARLWANTKLELVQLLANHHEDRQYILDKLFWLMQNMENEWAFLNCTQEEARVQREQTGETYETPMRLRRGPTSVLDVTDNAEKETIVAVADTGQSD